MTCSELEALGSRTLWHRELQCLIPTAELMPRLNRVVLPVDRVTQRGNPQKVFLSTAGRLFYLQLLAEFRSRVE